MDDVKAAIEVQQSSDRRVTKAEVARAVKSLLTEDAGRVVRENVEKLRDLALKAVAKGGSVERNCETFIKELQTVHSTVKLQKQPCQHDGNETTHLHKWSTVDSPTSSNLTST